MTAVLLALALCAAGPPAHDAIFARVVEAWVEGTMPPGDVQLVGMLACPRYECREHAEEELAHLGRLARPALEWATRHRDPEVRHRARRLLDELAYCPACRGSGRGAFLYDTYDEDLRAFKFHFASCPACDGTGLRR